MFKPNKQTYILGIVETQNYAAALFDGGWRATDKDELITEYNLTEEEADKVCALLEQFEKEE